jgi:hypothetical protein
MPEWTMILGIRWNTAPYPEHRCNPEKKEVKFFKIANISFYQPNGMGF